MTGECSEGLGRFCFFFKNKRNARERQHGHLKTKKRLEDTSSRHDLVVANQLCRGNQLEYACFWLLGCSRPLVGVDTEGSEVFKETLNPLFFLVFTQTAPPHQFSEHYALQQCCVLHARHKSREQDPYASCASSPRCSDLPFL